MTTVEAVEYIKVLLDKYGSPELEDNEIIDFLNHAQHEYINRCLPSNQGGTVDAELDQNVITNLRSVIYKLSVGHVNGLISNNTLDTALIAAAGESTTTLRVISIGQGTVPIKFTKSNNRFAFENNAFKRPTTDAPRYILTSQGIQMYPTTITGSVEVTVIKRPRLLADDNSPQWLDYQMYSIIGIALQLAGVSVRDQELIELDIRNTVQNLK